MLASHCEDMVLIPGQPLEICGIQNSVWLNSSQNTLIFHANHNFNNAADHSVTTSDVCNRSDHPTDYRNLGPQLGFHIWPNSYLVSNLSF
jgi:hypothetical protein